MIPDYLEPIIGYRVWKNINGHLASLNPGFGSMKPYKAYKARHALITLQACNGVPCDGNLGSVCGIHAYKKLDKLYYNYFSFGQFQRLGLIVGKVYLWGRIVEHEHGYRAQYAYPAELFHPLTEDTEHIALKYGIPFKENEEWQALDDQSENSYQSPWYSLFQPNWSQWISPSQAQNLYPPKNITLVSNPTGFQSQWVSRYILNPEMAKDKIIVIPDWIWKTIELTDPADKIIKPTEYKIGTLYVVNDIGD